MKKVLLSLSFLVLLATGKAQGPAVNLAFPDCNNAVYAVKYDSARNAVYVGGSFTFVGSTPRTRFASMNATTGAVNTWNPTFDNYPWDFLIVDHYLYVVGTFNNVNGTPRNHAAKFDLTTQTLTSWNPAVTGSSVMALEYNDGSIYLSSANTVYQVDTANTAAITWSTINDGYAGFLKVNGGFLYALGNYTQMDGQTRYNISAFDISSGTPVLDAWAPDADATCNYIDFYNNMAYVSGNFSVIAGTSVSNLTEISLAGNGPATSTGWSPPSTSNIQRIRVKGDYLYYFNYSTPMREIYLPTHTITNWVVNFSSGFAWDMYGFDMSPTKVYVGGGWSIGCQASTKKNFATLCAGQLGEFTPGSISGSGNVCVGAPAINYTVTPPTGATTYSWTYAGPGTVTTSGSTNNVNFDFSAATAGAATISVVGSNGCVNTVGTETLSISTYDFVVNISGTSPITCGDSTVLTGSDNYAGSGTVNYAWTPATALSYTNTTATTSGSHTTITYQLDLISTEGCRAGNGFTVNVNPIVVTPTVAFGGNILCATNDTIYLANDYPGAGSVTYTWSPSIALNTSDPDTVVAAPVVTTDYTITASSSDGCVATPVTVNISVTPITLTPQASPATITCGNTSTLTVSDNYPGSGSITYTWSPSADLTGANTASPVSSTTTGITYSLDITTTEGCQSSAQVFVNVDPLQITPSMGLYTVTCGGATMMNTSNNSSNPNLVYSWLPTMGLSDATISNPVATPSSQTIYTVTMSLPSTGCADAVAIDTVNILAPQTPFICEVTTDDSSKNNIIYWNKTPFTTTDSFIVYRETTTNIYTKIATIAQTDSSFYVDTARSIGPANGNPNIGSYRYKLAVKDSCGYISGLSPYHNTVYFIDNQTGVFTWNLYAVESAATPVTTFELWRDNNNNGFWILVGSVTGNQTTLNDPNYALHQSLANWRVEAQGFNCTPTARQNNGALGAIVKSKSNITNNRVVGIKNNTIGNVIIYPNPNSGKFVVDLGTVSGKISVKIFNMLGEEVYSNNTTAVDRLPVDLSAFDDGTYVIQVSNEKNVTTKRIIKN